MVEQAASRLSEFRAGLLWSRFYRVRAFVPMLAGDPDGMVRDMDEAERIARALKPANEAERFAAAEILWPVLESRVREAQFLHDLPLAESRAELLIAAAPLNPRAWLHLGEVLLDQERYDDAIPVYREAHRLGPPASDVALFNLGQCHEMLDQAEPAMDAYAELLQIDPLAISAAERIAAIAAEFGGRYRGWADAILGSLQTIETNRAA
jgi:tetratricopeptide (TPR) repeat protein